MRIAVGAIVLMFILPALTATGFLGQTNTHVTNGDAGDDPKPVRWDCSLKNKKNEHVSWRAKIGFHTGPAQLGGNRIFVGSDTELDDPETKGKDLGVFTCLTLDGKVAWKKSYPRLKSRNNDWPCAPVRSQPVCDDDAVYFVNNRGELLCVEMESGKERWRLDMVTDLKVYRREGSEGMNPVSSPVLYKDWVFCGTGNGCDEEGIVPSPDAPSLVAVNRKTGKLVWSDNSPGKNIMYVQWSSPIVANVGDTMRIIYCAGDGWIYGYDPPSGELVWKVDCNEPDATPWIDGPGTRQFYIATPVAHEGILYVGMGCGFELQKVPGPICAVDLSGEGDQTKKAIRWKFQPRAFKATFTSVAIKDKILFAWDIGDAGDKRNNESKLYAVDIDTGEELWREQFEDSGVCFVGPMLSGNTLFVPAEAFRVFLFEASASRKLLGYYDFGNMIDGALAADRDHLYVPTYGTLHAVKLPK